MFGHWGALLREFVFGAKEYKLNMYVYFRYRDKIVKKCSSPLLYTTFPNIAVKQLTMLPYVLRI
jgi:hypothetical protein